LKQHKPWFDENCLRFFSIEENKLKCGAYSIQTKAM